MPPTGSDALAGTDAAAVDLGGTDPNMAAPYPYGNPVPPPPHVLAGDVADAANRLAASNPNLQRPGSWARALMGGVQDALAGFGAGGRVPPGAGGLYGVGAAERQIQARKAAQAQQQFENQQKLSDEARQDAIAKATIFHENVMAMYQEQLSAQLNYENRQKNIENDTKLMAPLTDGGAPVIQEGIDSTEAENLIRTRKLDPSQQHKFATGQKPILDANGNEQFDQDGNPLTRPTYTIVGDVPRVRLAMNSDAAKFIADNTGHKEFYDPNSKDVISMPGLVYGTLKQRATTAFTAKAAADEDRADAGIKELNAQAAQDFLKMAPDWGPALAKTKNDPFAALAYIQSDPKMKQKYPNATAAVQSWYGGPEKFEENRQKNIENAKKKDEGTPTPATETGLAGTATGMTSTLTPEMQSRVNALPAPAKAALSRFDPAMQSSLMSVAYGENDLDLFPQRLTKGAPGIDRQTAAGIIQQLNPAFDPTRAGAYKQARKDFSAGGKDGTAINRLNTAIEHLSAFNDSAGTWLSTVPGVSGVARVFGSANANAFKTAKTALASELAGAYKGQGAPSEGEIKEWEDNLDGSTPAQVKAKVQSALGLLESKRDSYNYQWQVSGVPGTNPPMQIVSPQAQTAAAKIRGAQSSANRAVAAVAMPPGTAGKAKGSDGNWYFVDGSGKALGQVANGQ